jgi:hypothetical protein
MRESYRYTIDPKLVIGHKKYLDSFADLNPIGGFLAGMSTLPELLNILAAEAFAIDRIRLYRSGLESAPTEQRSAYLRYLEAGVLAQDKGQWEKTLISKSGPDFELLGLAADLRKFKTNFELSTSARDAVLDHIRKVAKDEAAPSEEARARLSNLLELLPDSLRHSVTRDIVDDMFGQPDSTQIVRIVEVVGEDIGLENETDSDRIVRRIFTPIVGSPTDRSAAWMAKVVGRRLDFFRRMPTETKDEFGWRLRTALQDKDKLTASIVESLTNTVGLLEIRFSEASGPEGPKPT